jgi:hypothetical protein
MTPAILHATRGDREVYRFTVRRAGAVVDISGKVLRFHARLTANASGSPIIACTIGDGIAIIDGPNGVCEVTIAPVKTTALDAPLRLTWDLELDEGGSPPGIATVGRGLLYVEADVTR